MVEKIKGTFHTFDPKLIQILRNMQRDGLAYECPPNHFHLVYPLEEYGYPLLTQTERKKHA